jgi:hypothetical protein
MDVNLSEEESEDKIIDEGDDKYYRKDIIKRIILFIVIIVIVIKTILVKKSRKEIENNYDYFFCFVAMGKAENLYAKEIYNYYKQLGVDKFLFADNNNANSEQFKDIFQKEINERIIEIIDIIGKAQDQTELYGKIYNDNKKRCRWMSFFDFDEFLVIKDDNHTNLTIQKYFLEPKFAKCDVILINWLVYSDNGLIRYDNRSMNERFTEPLYYHQDNRFVKAIIKGNIAQSPWIYGQTPHRPEYHLRTCDSNGNRVKTFNDVIKPPRLKNVYIKHFVTKTAEEYIKKVKRGHPGNVVLYFDKRIDIFFIYNKVTEEKIRYFEESLNMSFPKYHYIFNNKTTA